VAEDSTSATQALLTNTNRWLSLRDFFMFCSRRLLPCLFALSILPFSASAQSNGTSAPTVTLTAAPGSAPYGTANTFSATVVPTQGSSQVTGSVSFLDGNTTLGTAQLTSLFNGPVTTSLALGPSFPGMNAGAFISADLNGDGKSDLIGVYSLGTGPDEPSSIQVRLGAGDGTFNTVSSEITVQDSVIKLGNVADVNGDGKLDLVLVVDQSGTSSLEYFPGNGDGTFGSAVTVYSGDLCCTQVMAADVNGDNLPDLVAVGGEATAGDPEITTTYILVFINQGAGTFPSPQVYGGTQSPSTLVAITDLNNDGKPDLVLIRDFFGSDISVGEVYVSLNQGGGTFGGQDQFVYTGPEDSEISVVARDFNGDKIPDLGILSIGDSTDLAILLGNGDGTFGTPSTTQLIPGPVSATMFSGPLFAGELNGNGVVDLVANGYYFPGNGNGTFGAPFFYETSFNVMFTQLIGVADLNGNGLDDIAILYPTNASSSSSAVFLGTSAGQATFTTSALSGGTNLVTAAYSGGGQFAAATSSPFSVDIAQQATSIALSSVNPDPALAGQNVTFQAHTAGSIGGPVGPTGSVAFQNGSTVLGTAAVDANGNASFVTSFPSEGNQTVTASYTGDGNYAVSSTSVVEAILPVYLLSASGSSTLTVASGQSGTIMLSLTSQNGFSGTATLACSGLPANASCSFSPSSTIPLSGSAAQNTTLTISTGAAVAGLTNPLETINALPASALLFVGLYGLWPWRNRKIRGTLLMAGGLFLAVSVLSACGGSSHSTSPQLSATPAGTYTIAVQATSGTIQQSTQITLVVN
jgi:hypothetical protein